MGWADLYAVIYAAPPGSSVFHAVEKGWTPEAYLLAEVIDGIAVGNWQRTEGAHKRPPKGFPDPFRRPVDIKPKPPEPKPKPRKGDTVEFGIGQASVTTVGEFMALRAKREAQWRKKHQKEQGA